MLFSSLMRIDWKMWKEIPQSEGSHLDLLSAKKVLELYNSELTGPLIIIPSNTSRSWSYSRLPCKTFFSVCLQLYTHFDVGKNKCFLIECLLFYLCLSL